VLIIAHRGAWAETGHPEQTRAAFEAAVRIGADGVECDVRLTADRQVVCHHDATAERLTGDPRAIHELTLAELRDLRWAEGSGGPVTLAELIDVCRAAGRPFVLAIELKHPNPDGTAIEAAVLDVLAVAGWDPVTAALGDVRVSLMTFNPESIPVLAAVVDPRRVTMLTAEAALDDIAYALDADDLAGADAAARAELQAQLSAALAGGRDLVARGVVGTVGPDLDTVRADPAAVRDWVSAGLTVRVWTVDDPEDAARCVDLGIAELETDAPRALLAWRDAAAMRPNP
jgi:glycerophosphoryl diester phosphodiesterase